jgi:hypothetical protein
MDSAAKYYPATYGLKKDVSYFEKGLGKASTPPYILATLIHLDTRGVTEDHNFNTMGITT